MAERTVAILGGSSAFLPALADALADAAARLPALELRLHGRNEQRLRVVAEFCNRLARARGVPQRYAIALDVANAAAGASVVVNQMRPGGFAARTRDERFPLEFGVPGDETIGPAAVAAAIRAAPVVLDAARAVQAVAPHAWFLNLTNPMGILLRVLQAVPSLRTFGLCELPELTLSQALSWIGRTRARVQVDYAGINHQGWFVRIAEHGADQMAAIVAALRAAPQRFPIAAECLEAQHALPLPYLRLYYHRQREVLAQRERQLARGEELERLAAVLYAAYAEDRTGRVPAALRRRDTRWYPLAVVPALAALLGGEPDELFVSEPNGTHLAGLPADAVVEKRVRLTAAGVAPVPLSDQTLVASHLPLLDKLCEFEALAARAAAAPSAELVIAALRTHPFGIDADAARAMLPFVLPARSGGDAA